VTYEDPSNAELGRRLDGIAGLIQGLIGRAEYAADQRGIEHRFTEHERDLSELRRCIEDGLRETGQRITDQEKAVSAQRRHWQDLIYTGIIPAIVAAIAIIVQWLLLGGTH
jgi:hypothetical protein